MDWWGRAALEKCIVGGKAVEIPAISAQPGAIIVRRLRLCTLPAPEVALVRPTGVCLKTATSKMQRENQTTANQIDHESQTKKFMYQC